MIRIVVAVLLVLGLGVTANAAQDAPRRSSATAPASGSASALVNLNTATAAQLESLPGIGKATAERILEYRQKNGSFKKIEDLMNVRGVGEKSFLKLKPMITVTPSKGEQAGQ